MLSRAAAFVNPEFHNEFVALCALYYSGEISEEEWALLQIHMGYCDSCHKTFLQYQRIRLEVIPAMAAEAASERENGGLEYAASLEEAERRLMSRLRPLSSDQQTVPSSRLGWKLPAALIAACTLGAVSLFTVYSLRTRIASTPPPTRAVPLPEQPSRERSVPSDRETMSALENARQRAEALERQAADVDSQLKQATRATAQIEKKLESEQVAHKQLSEEKIALSQQLAEVQAQLATAREKWAAAGADVAQQSERSTTLESQVRELKTALEEKDVALSEKDRMLALDKDFLSHDRDIRDLIGARNLYIADIFDTNENGRTAKQFGRIFYTRDRSLIFYGFDLDSQAEHKQNVSFQVWGSGSDRSKPVSLGLFYQDDSHKRWVLRCNDARTLARLDMVFVTVEPPGGSVKPTGRQLLRAYLQIHPNHP